MIISIFLSILDFETIKSQFYLLYDLVKDSLWL